MIDPAVEIALVILESAGCTYDVDDVNTIDDLFDYEELEAAKFLSRLGYHESPEMIREQIAEDEVAMKARFRTMVVQALYNGLCNQDAPIHDALGGVGYMRRSQTASWLADRLIACMEGEEHE